MNLKELNIKIDNTLSELRSDIEKFIRENAKLKVGDIVHEKLNSGDKSYYVITQIGFEKSFGVVYYGSKVVKSTGEVSYQDMCSNVGIPEYSLVKATLVVNKKEISRIEEHRYFRTDFKIHF